MATIPYTETPGKRGLSTVFKWTLNVQANDVGAWAPIEDAEEIVVTVDVATLSSSGALLFQMSPDGGVTFSPNVATSTNAVISPPAVTSAAVSQPHVVGSRGTHFRPNTTAGGAAPSVINVHCYVSRRR